MTLPSADILAALAGSALDYVGIDCQHSRIDEAGAVALMGSAPVSGPTLVRVSANRPEYVGRVLDGGADGVIVPAVNSAAEAEAIVRAVSYPPDGDRSFGPISTHLPRDPAELRERVLVLPMVETVEGLNNVEGILAVRGVGGVYVGPSDLGIALGVGHRQIPPHPGLHDPLRAIAAAGQKTGKVVAIHAASHTLVDLYADFGYRMMTLESETRILQAGIAHLLNEAHQQTTPAPAAINSY